MSAEATEAAAATAPGPVIADADRDSLHILPLAIIPLTTAGLRRNRMLKNSRLDTMVEVFADSDAGSGQIEVGQVGRHFGWPVTPMHPDLVLLRKLETLPSFDVYSLRILLRENAIPLTEGSSLNLSPAKITELTSYMVAFTNPLVREIFGTENENVESFKDILELFRAPDVKNSLTKLQNMADTLGLQIQEIPLFLENYGDIFLSLSYYRQCLDRIMPMVEAFLISLNDITKNFQFRHDANLIRTCKTMESTINELMAAITGRFENFERSTNDMWKNLSAERFRRVEQQIKSYHTTIGGTLCALSVKMDAWAKYFPNPSVGGPTRRADFVMTEMRHGMEKIKKIEDSAPMMANVA